MTLSNNQITKALIRLRGCAGWSAPLLFANPRIQVISRHSPYNIALLQGHDQTDLYYQARGYGHQRSRDLLVKLELEDLNLILREALASKDM